MKLRNPALVSASPDETKLESGKGRALSKLAIILLLGVPIVVLGKNMITSGSFSAPMAEFDPAEKPALIIVPREPPAAFAIAIGDDTVASTNSSPDEAALNRAALPITAFQVTNIGSETALPEIVPADQGNVGVPRRGQVARLVAREFSDGKSFWRVGKGSKVVRSPVIKSLADAAIWAKRTRATPASTARPIARLAHSADRG